MKELRSLDLRGCWTVTPAGVTALMKACEKLVLFEGLQVDKEQHVTDEVVSTLAASRPNTEALDLRGCAKVTGAGVAARSDCEAPRL